MLNTPYGKILEWLVAEDTTSNDGNPRSNIPLVNLIRNYYDRFQVPTHVIPNADGTQANVVAIIGPRKPGGIGFFGHLDVVLAGDLEKWKGLDPFKVTELNGRLYGRGTADMKGFIANVLAKVPAWVAANKQKEFNTPIIMVWTFFEEIGCKGVPSALEYLIQENLKPRVSFVGEPTNRKMGGATNSRFDVHVCPCATGSHPAFANRADRTNALKALFRLGSMLEDDEHLIGVELGDTVPQLNRMILGPAIVEPAIVDSDKPWITEGRNIFGRNVVPNGAFSSFDIRARADLTEGEVEALFRRYGNKALARTLMHKDSTAAAGTNFVINAIRANPGFVCRYPEAMDLAKKIMEVDDADVVAMPYVCEAGILAMKEYDFPAVIKGPCDIGRAHLPLEYAEPEELRDFDRRLDNVLQYVM